MDELAFSDATSLAAKIRDKEISSVELLEHYIARMERYNPDINAIIVTQLDKARARAKEADQALGRGESWGPLHGVPMTVKESYNIAGLPTTWGNPELKNNIADSDAVACERLQSAGAIIFGKTNVPIFLSDFQSYNEIYGTTNNPFDLERGPGGSSGGAAAALAAGLTGLEMGSDIGGSIRNPAHYCGVFGHKPTWGVLPMRGHALPGVLSPSDISVIGPLGRSAEDLRLAMDLVAGADDLHVPGWKLELSKPAWSSFKDLRVAVWADDEMAPVDQEIKDRVLKVAKLVSDAGGKVDYDARPAFKSDWSHEQYTNLLHSAMSARQPEEVFKQNWERRQTLAADDDSQLAKVTRASTLFYREWHAYNENRTHLRWAWHEFFKEFDLLLTPMCSTAAFPHDHNPQMTQRLLTINNEPRPYFEQVFWAGLTGVSFLPSTVVPTGLNDRGLPIGVQIVGREMFDLHTIEFARLVAGELGGFVPPSAYED
ncbi:MAG: amidase [Pseudomonadales bacterium]|nr:amidase [Pseudomonadales bacterium]